MQNHDLGWVMRALTSGPKLEGAKIFWKSANSVDPTRKPLTLDIEKQWDFFGLDGTNQEQMIIVSFLLMVIDASTGHNLLFPN